MNVKCKKIISVALSLATLTACLSACSDDKKAKTDSDKMTITWLGQPYWPEGEEGATIGELKLEEKFNVDIKPIFLDSEGYKTKKPMMMAGGEIPDLIYEMDPINVRADVEQGFLAELPFDTIKKYAPSILKEVNEQVPQAWMYSNYEGKNYGIPTVYYAGTNPRLGIWRMDWLKNVGINKVPETLDEMYDAFVKFRDMDPDKNGKKDTYGMSGDVKATYSTFTEIFGAFGVLPFNWMKVDGEIVYGGFQPQMRDALSLLANWYKEGLIDPELITDDVLKSGLYKFQNGRVGYINTGGNDFKNLNLKSESSNYSVAKTVNPDAEWEPAVLPKGPNGESGAFVWGKGGNIISFGKHLEKQPEKLQKILEILEYMTVNPDFTFNVKAGDQGVHWDYIKEDEEEETGEVVERIAPYDEKDMYGKLLNDPSGDGPNFWAICWNNELSKYNNKYIAEHIAKYVRPELGRPDVFLKPDVVQGPELNDIKNKQIILITSVITGKISVDDYFNEFTKEWNNLGGVELAEKANQVGEIMTQVYKEAGVEQ